MSSPRVPPMAGHCPPRTFAAHTRQAAELARTKHRHQVDNILDQWSQLSPTAIKRQNAETAFGRMLGGLLLVFLLWCLSNCQSVRPASEAHAHAAEHAQPYGWHEADSLRD